jgi:hypothetical protein
MQAPIGFSLATLVAAATIAVDAPKPSAKDAPRKETSKTFPSATPPKDAPKTPVNPG